MISVANFFAILICISIRPLSAAEMTKIAPLYGQVQYKIDSKITGSQLHLSARLNVAEKIELAHARIYLRDIATCEGSAGLCAEILAVDLGSSPKPGQERILLVEELRKALAQEFPQHDIDIPLKQRLRLLATMKPLDTALIRNQVEKKLAEDTCKLRVIVMSLRLPMSIKLRHNNYAFEFPSWQQDFAPVRQNPRRSLVSLMVRIVDQESGSSEQFDAVAQVLLRNEALQAVVTKPMERGQLLDKNSIEWQWLPYQENAIRSPFSLEKQLLRLVVRPGQILRTFDLTRDPDVKRGEKVQAFVQTNGVKMNSAAQALESATIGQRIRIQLETTKRQVMATVTGPLQVEVHMP